MTMVVQRSSRRLPGRICLCGSLLVDIRTRVIATDLLLIHETMSKITRIENICILTVQISHIKTALGSVAINFHANCYV